MHFMQYSMCPGNNTQLLKGVKNLSILVSISVELCYIDFWVVNTQKMCFESKWMLQNWKKGDVSQKIMSNLRYGSHCYNKD